MLFLHLLSYPAWSPSFEFPHNSIKWLQKAIKNNTFFMVSTSPPLEPASSDFWGVYDVFLESLCTTNYCCNWWDEVARFAVVIELSSLFWKACNDCRFQFCFLSCICLVILQKAIQNEVNCVWKTRYIICWHNRFKQHTWYMLHYPKS